ncbi:phospholipase D-like domain-containing protein [Massilia sp. SR12]
MTGMNSNADLYTQVLSYRSNAAPIQCLAQPWFIRACRPVYYPRYGCSIEPLICGEEVFGHIAKDLLSARHSVDIITWGFDPGMVLVRGETAESGVRLGDLLKNIATRSKNGVKVRLLVWHDDLASHAMMNNNPGYYGRFPSVDGLFTGHYSETHQTYNEQWYAQVFAGAIPNIELHVRKISTKLLDQSVSHEVVPSGLTAEVAAMYAAHHQKMMLFDYEIPKLARGYVMGHNFITDFWDTKEHKYRDKRRERFYKMSYLKFDKQAWMEGENFDRFHSAMTDYQKKKEEAVQLFMETNSLRAKPYQDVSCRLRGPILYDLNHNFCQGWAESKPPNSLLVERQWFISNPQIYITQELGTVIEYLKHEEIDAEFFKRRAQISLSAFNLPYGHHNAQLLRTQPLHSEKLIKECYANLTREMRHYIFIQNQYVQYQPWADHLRECVGRLRSAGYLKPIFVFILTSTPEKPGMDLPTYDVVNVLGMSERMPVLRDQVITNVSKGKARLPISASELAASGINVFMGSLWTYSKEKGEEKLEPADYEEIYIHSKVAIVDDAAFTIGSANLNLRSMALDSELNILSEAKDVAYQLRVELFGQCSGQMGPVQFGDMERTFNMWDGIAKQNQVFKNAGEKLMGQLLPFHVDRKPGAPVV